MFKLSSDSIKDLDSLIQTALIGGIKKLIVSDGKIRGIDEKQKVVIVTSNKVPDFGNLQFGTSRLDSLASRMSLLKNQGLLDIVCTEYSNNIDVAQLDLSAGKSKAQFRCTPVDTIKGVPKNYMDTLVWEINIDSKVLPIIIQAVSAIGADNITIASKDGLTVLIELIDTNKDVFSSDLSDSVTWIGENSQPSSFCNKYPAKILVSLLKEAFKSEEIVKLSVGEGGILSFEVNKFGFLILPSL